MEELISLAAEKVKKLSDALIYIVDGSDALKPEVLISYCDILLLKLHQ